MPPMGLISPKATATSPNFSPHEPESIMNPFTTHTAYVADIDLDCTGLKPKKPFAVELKRCNPLLVMLDWGRADHWHEPWYVDAALKAHPWKTRLEVEYDFYNACKTGYFTPSQYQNGGWIASAKGLEYLAKINHDLKAACEVCGCIAH